MKLEQSLSNLILTNSTELSLVFLITLVIGHFLFRNFGRKGPLPPGPWGLPILGYLPLIGREPQFTFNHLAKKYGPLFGLTIGRRYAIVLNDFDSMADAFRRKEFNGRPDGAYFMSNNITNFGEMNRDNWTEHKRFLDMHMRNFLKSENGLGIHRVLADQIPPMLSRIEESCKSSSTNIRYVLGEATTNITSDFVYGKDFEFDGITKGEFVEYQTSMLNQARATSLPMCLPFLERIWRKIIPSFIRMEKIEAKVEQSFKREIEKREKNLNENDLRSYMDEYLSYMKKTNDHRYSKENLNGNSQLMVVGGTDAVRSALEWLIMCLAKYQDVQEKVYQECLEVFGTDKQPIWNDRHLLPFTVATIYESQRFKTAVPINTIRCTVDDVSMKGYFIPKDTLVLMNIWAIHNDPKHFPNPSAFEPSRYLNQQGNINNGERLLSFSFGRRRCPGKEQALNEMFVLSLAILQRYKILPPEEGLSMEEEAHLVVLPAKPYVRFEKRIYE